MIIVEGPDGAGKSTLIRQIQKRWPDLEVAPRVVSPDTKDLVDLQQWVDHNLAEGFQYKLFDRYRLISEFIYGPALRYQMRPGFTSRVWTQVSMRKFRDISPVIIYCMPPLEIVKANIENDPENEVVLEKIEAVYTGYLHRIALDSLIDNFKVIVWDYTMDDFVERRSMIQDRGMTEEEADHNILNPLAPAINYAKGRAE